MVLARIWPGYFGEAVVAAKISEWAAKHSLAEQKYAVAAARFCDA